MLSMLVEMLVIHICSKTISSRTCVVIVFHQARLDILKIHSRKMNLTRGINLRKIAELMPGASGAEVKVRNVPLNDSPSVVNAIVHR